MPELPPCGLYKTLRPLADKVPAGRLVFFHNHGEPGAGIYLPERWHLNRAQFSKNGFPIPSPEWAKDLEPLPAEGFYRVREPFHCCDKRCRLFEAESLVQLGYDGEAHPLLFVPEWTDEGMAIPDTGTSIDAGRLAKLSPLKVPHTTLPAEAH
ncbi:MAG: hypothetical protein QM765_14680 [Myxococcales bacterium]